MNTNYIYAQIIYTVFIKYIYVYIQCIQYTVHTILYILYTYMRKKVGHLQVDIPLLVQRHQALLLSAPEQRRAGGAIARQLGDVPGRQWRYGDEDGDDYDDDGDDSSGDSCDDGRKMHIQHQTFSFSCTMKISRYEQRRR